MTSDPNSPPGDVPPPVTPPPIPEPAAAATPEATEALMLKHESQIRDLTDRLLRAHAEMDNMRKRAERERDETAKFAITKFARDIVGVSDNFQRAIAAVPAEATDANPALQALFEGVSLTERELLNVLERHGVKRVDPIGELFSPHRHQAMMEVDNAEVTAGTIMQVFQPGYIIEDRVIRPAMVVVAKGGAKPGKPAETKPANGAPDDAAD